MTYIDAHNAVEGLIDAFSRHCIEETLKPYKPEELSDPVKLTQAEYDINSIDEDYFTYKYSLNWDGQGITFTSVQGLTKRGQEAFDKWLESRHQEQG